MFRQNLWKLSASFAIVLWALFTLIPLQHEPFDSYLRQEVTADKEAEFGRLLTRADERIAAAKAAGREVSVFTALKQIALEDDIDLTVYFPQINIESTLKNKEKRNHILFDELLRQSKGSLQLGLDLNGGVAFTLEADPAQLATLSADDRKEKLAKALEIISKRVNALGVAEPIIRPIGENRIEVQLPGVTTKDNPEILNTLKKPARLDFRLVAQGTGPMAVRPSGAPAGYEILSLEEEDKHTGAATTYYYLVKVLPEMSGENIDNASPQVDPTIGSIYISLDFNSDGAKQFGQVTEANVGRLLGIVLDGKLYSAPQIKTAITGGRATITGHYTAREAKELADVLNNPLEIPLKVTEQYEVGPSLAKDAIISGKNAFIWGTVVTIAFILGFYTLGGVVAAIGIAVNVLVVLAMMSSFGATVTLPGIAGIVLTLAMSVDSNILIFERMREELRLGKSLATALEAGFEKAWSAILDGNLTTLITSAMMIILGTGAVKGFGVTLTIGIFTTMFAAVVVSKLVLELLVLPGYIKNIHMFSVLQDTKFDFLKMAKPAFIVSWVIVAIGFATVLYKGKSIYGPDFVGGDSVSLAFAKKIDADEVRKAVHAAGFEDANPIYRKQIGSDLEVLKITTPFEQGAKIVELLQQRFPEAKFSSEGITAIGPSVGEEIQWNALWSLFWAMLLILVYIAFRFEFGYGVGAVVATVHDLLMTVGIFVLFDRQFNASMVAAILLVAGYSINDTIVVFDRIREELKINPTGTLRDMINRSLNLTLARTIITGGTTLLTAIILMVVTGGEVNDIAFTLFIGVITGTFSSLFIASPIFYWWHKGDRKHVEAHEDIAPKYEWAGSSRASE